VPGIRPTETPWIIEVPKIITSTVSKKKRIPVVT
jgi:hypothetical protein